MMSMKLASSATLAVVSAAALLALGACGREADRAARADAGSAASQTSVASARSDYASSRSDSGAGETRRTSRVSDADVRKSDDGKPMWASNRTRSGEENAQKQFERNGQDFSAASLDDYVRKAHAFVDSPPKTVLTVARRNGDVLFYDPKANVFAVADREGAPRAMFKPRDGMAYWQQQKQSASDSSRRRTSSRYASRDDRRDSGSDGDSEG
jgi:pyocin large subunit-like protein